MDTATDVEQVEQSESADIQQIDFKKYQTAELFESISELLGLSGKLQSIIRWTVIGCALAMVAIGIFAFNRFPLLLFLVLFLYGIPAGMSCGGFFGIAETIRRSLTGMLGVIDLLLKITAEVANDARALYAGKAEFPPAGKLVFDVYENVIYPVVEKVVTGALGFVGTPVLWVYRMTFDRMVRLVVKRYIDLSVDEKSEMVQELKQNATEIGGVVGDNETVIVSQLNWARNKVNSVGWWLRILVMIPCYSLFLIAVFLAMIPFLVAAFIAESDDGEILQPAMQILSWM